MAQTNVTIRMDENDKLLFDRFCETLGLSMSSAINIYVKKTLRESRIPFELSIDPFYSEENMSYLRESLRQAKEGKVITKTLEELKAMENE